MGQQTCSVFGAVVLDTKFHLLLHRNGKLRLRLQLVICLINTSDWSKLVFNCWKKFNASSEILVFCNLNCVVDYCVVICNVSFHDFNNLVIYYMGYIYMYIGLNHSVLFSNYFLVVSLVIYCMSHNWSITRSWNLTRIQSISSLLQCTQFQPSIKQGTHQMFSSLVLRKMFMYMCISCCIFMDYIFI